MIAAPEIVADTSAFVAVYRQEPEASSCEQVLSAVPRIFVPASCHLEAALLHRAGRDFFSWFRSFTSPSAYAIAELDAFVMDAAIEAARIYGKGSGHPARLNFGDCLSYAVAKRREAPLLFVGEDFIHTDLAPAR